MLVVDRIQRSFGPVQAVRDISFHCAPGSVLGLLGPNGAGKTTTMRMILGIYPPDAGTVTWQGGPIAPKVRRSFGYLPEERGLYGKMRAADQIAYFGRLHGLEVFEAEKRAQRWLERLQLGEYARRPCGELSKGNQQKVQVACALIHSPPLLVLDEPFSGLDPVNADTMLSTIRELAAGGTAVVLSSHQMWQIENACDAFCIISAGAVRTAGTLTELRRAFPTRTVRVKPDLPQIRGVFARFGSAPHLDADGTLEYELPAATDFGALLREAVAAGPVDAFERVEPPLHEIYLRALEAAA